MSSTLSVQIVTRCLRWEWGHLALKSLHQRTLRNLISVEAPWWPLQLPSQACSLHRAVSSFPKWSCCADYLRLTHCRSKETCSANGCARGGNGCARGTWLPFYHVPGRELPVGRQPARCWLVNVSLACHWQFVLRTRLLPWGGGDVVEPNHSVPGGLLAPQQWDCPRPALLGQTPWIANELFPATALIVPTTNCSPPPIISRPLVVSNCVWRCRQWSTWQFFSQSSALVRQSPAVIRQGECSPRVFEWLSQPGTPFPIPLLHGPYLSCRAC